MSKKRDLMKKDWYEILNENLKYINKDMNNLQFKKEQIMNEQLKLNKVNLLRPSLDYKYKNKSNNELKNKTDISLSLQKENKLIVNRLNLKNYKTKNYIRGNNEYLFLRDILERIDKISSIRIYKSKYKKNKTELSTNQNTFRGKSNNLTSRNKKGSKIFINDKKVEKIFIPRNKNFPLSKTFNNYSSEKNISKVNTTFFPKIKNKKNKNLNVNEENRKIVEILQTEEDNLTNRAKTMSQNILKFNKDFIKNKRIIFGYNDKKEDYIVINNKKIYPLNIEKEINKNFRNNFSNIKKIEDIEQKLLNDDENIFDQVRKNLVLKYKNKTNKYN